MTGIRNFALREGSEGPTQGASIASLPDEAVFERSGSLSHGQTGTRKVRPANFSMQLCYKCTVGIHTSLRQTGQYRWGHDPVSWCQPVQMPLVHFSLKLVRVKGFQGIMDWPMSKAEMCTKL